MVQIITLPVQLSEYPQSFDALDPAEHVLLHAVRCWVVDFQTDAQPESRLHDIMSAAGVPDAAISLDLFMKIAVRTASRRVTVQDSRSSYVSEDERRLLYAASVAQSGTGGLVEAFLRDALLSGSGAEFAFGPLKAVSALFNAAGFHFRQRKKPPDPLELADAAGLFAGSPMDRVVRSPN